MGASQEDWEGIAELFGQAMALPPGERLRFVETAPMDGETRRILRRLIQEDADAGDFLGQPVARVKEAIDAPSENLVGVVLAGRYRIEEAIGRGGAGVVYRALDLTGRFGTVVIKLLHDEARDNPWLRRKFQSEAQALDRLEHPHIVRILDHGETERGEPFLVMEHIAGRTLRSEIQKGPLPLPLAASIVRQIGGALDAAHQCGIVHRDLKPENIMLAGEGVQTNAKVIDFGIARVRGGGAETETGVRLMAGTTRYMAPEQLLGAPGDASDIYALGAMAYEMVAGICPYPSDGPAEILMQQGAGRVRDLREIRREVSRRAWRLIRKSLAFRAEDRPARAGPFAGELAAALEKRRAWIRVRWPRIRVRWPRLSRRWVVVSATAGIALAAVMAVYRFHPGARLPSLTRITFDDFALNTEPAISADRKWIAYASNRSGEGNLDLWISAASGGSPRRLTRGEIHTRQAEFTPDGRSILFRSDRDGGGIFQAMVNPAPGLTVSPMVARGGLRPKFSPDGKQIAYWTGLDGSGDLLAPGGSKLYVLPAEGGIPRQVCPEFAAAAYPNWSPDGKSILFLGRRSVPVQGAEPTVWITRAAACAPIGIGSSADFIGNPIEMALLDRWLPGDRLLFRYSSNAAAGLFELRFSAATGAITERAKRVVLPVNGVNIASVLDESTMAFPQPRSESSLWTMPIDAEGGAGPPARVVECAGAGCVPALSPDGSTLFYSRLETGWEFVQRDFGSAAETIVERAGKTSPWPFIARSGSDLLFARSTSNVDRYTVIRVSSKSGQRETLCADCPELWDVSPSGKKLLGMSAGERRTVSLVEIASQHASELLSHPQWNLYRASFSPDERSILFTAKVAPDRSQIFVAAFDGSRCAPPGEWAAVSGDTEYNGPAHWSVSGDRVYFTSQRDGHRCFYARAWDRKRGAATGPIVAVRHFHAEAESPGLVSQALFGFAVGGDQIVFAMGRQRGDIWMLN
ncbi:putative Serine/threonine protein kinase [Candidatus Sulfopaludibacter sp. SbA4]|nr:putative Serine/threonine protein kinase [Candidatus Sulfopaludibacter sp. SbA4]